MPVAPAKIVHRYLAARSAHDDARFQPPKWLVAAVDSGEIQVECLNVWKYVTDQLGNHFDYGAAVKYWRNKCLKMGYAIPEKFIEGGGGEGAAGPWRVKTGDQIEEWVKATLKSHGLLADVGRSVHDWQMEIGSLEREVAEAQGRVDKHLAAMAGGKVNAQRKKWLDSAQADLIRFSKQLSEANDEMQKLVKTAARYEKHKSPTLEFEKEFQFMMLVASKDFDKKQILEAVSKAIERFETGMEIPDAGPGDDSARYQGYKAAGIGDLLDKAINWLKSAWALFTGWIADLAGTTKKLDKMLSEAGA
jgi:hypothetical protein